MEDLISRSTTSEFRFSQVSRPRYDMTPFWLVVALVALLCTAWALQGADPAEDESAMAAPHMGLSADAAP